MSGCMIAILMIVAFFLTGGNFCIFDCHGEWEMLTFLEFAHMVDATQHLPQQCQRHLLPVRLCLPILQKGDKVLVKALGKSVHKTQLKK